MRPFLYIFILLFLLSCGSNPDQEIDSAIDVALTHLSNNECDDALKVLGEIKDGTGNAIFLQVLASAHACKANHDEVRFIAEDLEDLDTTSFATIMSSLSKFALSSESEADSNPYTSIKAGINTILSSTAGVPSHLERVNKFGTRKAGDLSVQALTLSLVNLGKFLNYYGNVDANGNKGKGTGTNTCFLNYTDTRARAVIDPGGLGGFCTVFNNGHPDLSLAAASLTTSKRRLCEGLMLVTNMLDVLENLDLSGSSTLSKLGEISAEAELIKTEAVAAGLGDLINMTSQSVCEDHLDTAANLEDMEYLYSLIFESGLQ